MALGIVVATVDIVVAAVDIVVAAVEQAVELVGERTVYQVCMLFDWQ